MKNHGEKLQAQNRPKRKKTCGCGATTKKQSLGRRKLSR